MTQRGWRVGEIWDARGLRGDALIEDSGTIEWVGWHGDLDHDPNVMWVVEPDALLVPGFVDAHVHLTATGVALEGLDLSGAACAEDIVEAVRRAADYLPAEAVVFGHGWDDSTWLSDELPTAVDLSSAAGGRTVYLSRVDVHSALVSVDLLRRQNEDHPGDGDWRDAGPQALVRKEAHGVARQAAFARVSARQREHLQRLALTAAAAHGITCVHENAGPVVSSLDDLTGAMSMGLSSDLPAVVGYWGALGEAAVAKRVGAIGAAGDLFVDGSIGSFTAHVCEPYAGSDSSGAAYVSRDEMAVHIDECLSLGVQAGFHVIGDAAMADVCWALEAVAAERGPIPPGAVRLEHAEMISAADEDVLMRHGVFLSMQPMFDALWGGPSGMYAQRLGISRAGRMNRIGDHVDRGILVGFGSDSPVTALGPWQAMAAAVRHQDPSQRITGITALAAHTCNGHALARRQGGLIEPGADADFSLWKVPMVARDSLFDCAIRMVADGGTPHLIAVYRQGNGLTTVGAAETS